MSSKQILTSIDPIAMAARAALERNREMLDRADRRAAALDLAEEDERLSRLSPTSIGPLGPGEEVSYEEPGVIRNPDSWLNRGLENIAGNAADILLGKPSGNDLVDLGAASVPGVGAAAILAAGGMPGVVDATGLGVLKNAKRIPKYTLEFVQKHFGDRGVANLDNALSRLPKAGKPSVKDAIYIMKSGLGGEQVPAIVPYTTNSTLNDLADLYGMSNEKLLDAIADGYDELVSLEGGKYRDKVHNLVSELDRGIEKNDLQKTNMYALALAGPAFGPEGMEASIQMLTNPAVLKQRSKSFQAFYQWSRNQGHTGADEKFRLMKELYESPLQDWDRIAAAQERKDASDAAKALRKVERQSQVPAPSPVQEMPARAPAREILEAPAAAPVPEPELPAVEMIPEGPEWTRKWKSKQYSPNFYERFGSRMDENSKRDLFVVDSLKNHWVNQLGDPENLGFSTAEILNGLTRADARHSKTNYNRISREFIKDIEKNIESGNMPGTAVKFMQKFKNNSAVDGKLTPTLMLRLDEKPRVYMDSRVWADEAEGPDLYELLFRPAVDRKLNSINPKYWEY